VPGGAATEKNFIDSAGLPTQNVRQFFVGLMVAASAVISGETNLVA
jgi:hypothetical protein